MTSGSLVLIVAFALGQLPPGLPEAEYMVETTVKVSSTGGGIIRASVPVLREWPEQRIEAATPQSTRCKIKVEHVQPGAACLTLVSGPLRGGDVASVSYRQQVFVKPQPRRRKADFPNLPAIDSKSKAFTAPTPTIDSADPAIRAKATELCQGIESPWEKAQVLSEWTYKHLEYKLMDYTSAKAAFENKIGDCEERASLFIALCRSQGIPARSVISPGKTRKEAGHAWAEILLANAEGKGEWLPVDVGLRWFAELPVAPPIIQKGDNYSKLGSTGARQRLLGTWARGGSGSLTFEFTQEVTPVSANAVLDPTQLRKSTPAPPNK